VSYGHRLMCDVETQFSVWYKIVSGGTTALCEIGPFFLSGSARPAKKGDLISSQVSIATQSTVVGAHRRSTCSGARRSAAPSRDPRQPSTSMFLHLACLELRIRGSEHSRLIKPIAHPWIRTFTLD
jgi:hypothetical protein